MLLLLTRDLCVYCCCVAGVAPCTSEIDDTFVANAAVIVLAYVDVVDVVAVVIVL